MQLLEFVKIQGVVFGKSMFKLDSGDNIHIRQILGSQEFVLP